MKPRTALVWLALVLLTVLPLWLVSAPPTPEHGDASEASALFAGADDRAQRAIVDIAPDYTPWFVPVFTPASAEIASLLFALQAAIGAGVIGYWLGTVVSRERERARSAALPTNLSKDGRAD